MKKKMKTWKKVLLIIVIILLVLAAAIAALCIWQRDNLRAVSYASKYEEKELESMAENIDSGIDDAIRKTAPSINPDNVTDEQKEAYRKGEISDEEFIALLLGKEPEQSETAKESKQITPDESAKKSETSAKPSETSKGKEPTETSLIEGSSDYYIAKIYALRESYVGKINMYLADAKAEYMLYAPQDRTITLQFKLADKYVGLGNSLEQRCDAEMDRLLGLLKDALQKEGKGTGVIEEIKALYSEEKTVKKALLLDKYYPD